MTSEALIRCSSVIAEIEKEKQDAYYTRVNKGS
jgi:hypothetical protein